MEPSHAPRTPEASAEEAALVHGCDTEPGIRRRRTAAGFAFVWPDGSRVADPRVIERIRALVIPPAWSDVWIALSPDCHLQVTGKDVRGRKQYRYHERWTSCRDEVKYSSLVEFARALPRLRRTVDADLARRGLPREKVLATVVWLLDNTLIRVGNPGYARDNHSYGLTTLRNRHVLIEGSTLRFGFTGKSGRTWNLKITDRRVARIVRQTQELPGQNLFQYLDEEAERRTVASQDVNAYLRAAANGPFSSKHFRTWAGTVRALDRFTRLPAPSGNAERKRLTNAVIDQVAASLGNTRTVCRTCYIHPDVISSWSEGRLAGEFAAVRRRFRRTPARLDRMEYLALRWLETVRAQAAA